MNAWAAITLITVLMYGPDLYQEICFFAASRARSSPTPSEVAAGGHLQCPAQRRDREAPVLLLDKLVSHCGRTVKIPTACYENSVNQGLVQPPPAQLSQP